MTITNKHNKSPYRWIRAIDIYKRTALSEFKAQKILRGENVSLTTKERETLNSLLDKIIADLKKGKLK